MLQVLSVLMGCAHNDPWWSKDDLKDTSIVEPEQGTPDTTLQVVSASDSQTPDQGDPQSQESEQAHPQPAPVEDPRAESKLDEIIRLYRRLHVELEPEGRNALIVELLNDERERLKLLGFDLASRDLGSGTTLDQQTAEITIQLLDDPRSEVRLNAVRLLSRLALPDSMQLLGKAIRGESDPRVAEALLRALERWPNAEARDDVLHWYTKDSSIHRAAASAAWALNELGAWNNPEARAAILDHARTLPDSSLSAADTKLIATLGGTEGVQRLLQIARDESSPIRNDVIDALTRTPAGVDPLLELLGSDPTYYVPMSRSLIDHRATPEGFRTLTALPAPSREVRRDVIEEMGTRLDTRDLDHSVRLARNAGTLDDELSIRVLQRLIANGQAIPARESPGVVLLASLELANARPDRAIEVLGFLPDSGIDPASALRAEAIRTSSFVLLGEFDRAIAQGEEAQPWLDALGLVDSEDRRSEIAERLLNATSVNLSEEQRDQVRAFIKAQDPSEPSDPADQPTTAED